MTSNLSTNNSFATNLIVGFLANLQYDLTYKAHVCVTFNQEIIMATCVVLLDRCDSVLTEYSSNHSKQVAINKRLDVGNMASCYVLVEKCDKAVTDSCVIKSFSENRANNLGTLSKMTAFECTCGNAFRNRQLLLSHINSHQEKVTSTGVPSNRCPTCQQSVSRTALRQRLHHVSSGLNHGCPICNNMYATAKQLTNHTCLASKLKPYRCNLCDDTFLFTRQLKQHVMSVHKVSSVRRRCKKCKSKFLHMDDLKLHCFTCRKQSFRDKKGKKRLKMSNKTNKDIGCDSNSEQYALKKKAKTSVQCNIKLAALRPTSSIKTSSLVRYENLVANEYSNSKTTIAEKPQPRSHCSDRYKCLQCDASFRNNVYFRRHTVSHKNLQLIHVQDSDALDSWKKQLEASLNMTIESRSESDSDIQKISCSVTDNIHATAETQASDCEGFSATSQNQLDLITHDKSHTVASGYNCSDCDAVFMDKKHLIHHMTAHHISVHPNTFHSKKKKQRTTEVDESKVELDENVDSSVHLPLSHNVQLSAVINESSRENTSTPDDAEFENVALLNEISLNTEDKDNTSVNEQQPERSVGSLSSHPHSAEFVNSAITDELNVDLHDHNEESGDVSNEKQEVIFTGQLQEHLTSHSAALERAAMTSEVNLDCHDLNDTGNVDVVVQQLEHNVASNAQQPDVLLLTTQSRESIISNIEDSYKLDGAIIGDELNVTSRDIGLHPIALIRSDFIDSTNRMDDQLITCDSPTHALEDVTEFTDFVVTGDNYSEGHLNSVDDYMHVESHVGAGISEPSDMNCVQSEVMTENDVNISLQTSVHNISGMVGSLRSESLTTVSADQMPVEAISSVQTDFESTSLTDKCNNEITLPKLSEQGQQLTSKYDLVVHKHHFKSVLCNDTQEAEKLYKCNECKATFSKKISLERHVRVHSGSNQHKCMQCNSAFSTEIYLNRHVSSSHKKKSLLH